MSGGGGVGRGPPGCAALRRHRGEGSGMIRRQQHEAAATAAASRRAAACSGRHHAAVGGVRAPADSSAAATPCRSQAQGPRRRRRALSSSTPGGNRTVMGYGCHGLQLQLRWRIRTAAVSSSRLPTTHGGRGEGYSTLRPLSFSIPSPRSAFVGLPPPLPLLDCPPPSAFVGMPPLWLCWTALLSLLCVLSDRPPTTGPALL